MSRTKYIALIEPIVYHFKDPATPCSYWSNGEHIVANGECRCGKKYDLLELK